MFANPCYYVQGMVFPPRKESTWYTTKNSFPAYFLYHCWGVRLSLGCEADLCESWKPSCVLLLLWTQWILEEPTDKDTGNNLNANFDFSSKILLFCLLVRHLQNWLPNEVWVFPPLWQCLQLQTLEKLLEFSNIFGKKLVFDELIIYSFTFPSVFRKYSFLSWAWLYLNKFVWFYFLGRGTGSKDVRKWNWLWDFKIKPNQCFSVMSGPMPLLEKIFHNIMFTILNW